MKIALLNMNVRNLGDRVIRDTSRYLLDEIIGESGLDSCEVVPVDIGEHRNFEPYSFPLRLAVQSAVNAFATRQSFSARHPEAARRALRWAWRHSTAGRCFRKRELPKLEGVDLIVFGGGGLVKFHRQSFHHMIDDVTGYALEHGTPVLFNAIGVEGYDEDHPGCTILKRALNQDCVKYISTRDDYASLMQNYVENPGIATACVCDPAFWTAETYGTGRKRTSGRRVGVNVIRPKIFKDYLREVEPRELDALYHDLVERLVGAGFEVALFSNGVISDTAYLKHLLRTYPDMASNPAVTHHTPQTPEEFVQLIAGFERLMAVRLHASIVACVLGVPNVSLVWNAKQPLFGERIGKPECFLERERFSADEVYDRLMAATPYQMDADYKDSVKVNLARQVRRWLAPDANGERNA